MASNLAVDATATGAAIAIGAAHAATSARTFRRRRTKRPFVQVGGTHQATGGFDPLDRGGTLVRPPSAGPTRCDRAIARPHARPPDPSLVLAGRRARRRVDRAAHRRGLGRHPPAVAADDGCRRVLPLVGDGARGRRALAPRVATRHRHRTRARYHAADRTDLPRRRRVTPRRSGPGPPRPRAALRA